jgi:hypothetical protein
MAVSETLQNYYWKSHDSVDLEELEILSSRWYQTFTEPSSHGKHCLQCYSDVQENHRSRPYPHEVTLKLLSVSRISWRTQRLRPLELRLRLLRDEEQGQAGLHRDTRFCECLNLTVPHLQCGTPSSVSQLVTRRNNQPAGRKQLGFCPGS